MGILEKRPTAMHTVDLPILLTCDEVARLLRTSRKAVDALIKRGQLPGVVRIGRRVLVGQEVLPPSGIAAKEMILRVHLIPILCWWASVRPAG